MYLSCVTYYYFQKNYKETQNNLGTTENQAVDFPLLEPRPGRASRENKSPTGQRGIQQDHAQCQHSGTFLFT